MRSLRSTYVSVLAATLMVIIVGWVMAHYTVQQWASTSPQDRLLLFDPIGAPLFGGVFAQLILGSLGALIVTSEYTTGLIRTTFAITPQRRKVFAAKALVIGATGFVVGAMMLGTAFFISEAVMGPSHGGVSLFQPGVFRGVGYGVLYTMIITLLGVGIGAIVRHTAVAITVLFSVVFIVPQILDKLPENLRNDVMRFGLSRACTSAVSLRRQAFTFSPTVSILICAAYAVVALVIGAIVIGRGDA
jgi:ABC-2 type transport system permease protein